MTAQTPGQIHLHLGAGKDKGSRNRQKTDPPLCLYGAPAQTKFYVQKKGFRLKSMNLKGFVADGKDSEGPVVGNCDQPLEICHNTFFCFDK